ncbi:expressed unknown protein [Seminavis robusta]|uniref:Uncharacterized protein n=1 Tax=Seminavis robusta TaxID=568900 RepID=A0A9N8H393_9STRA|nr:expressed unknown protein [Seminavis robusta]|eukprot:Sro54_g032100.1 n/a (540) ;mRNA; r:138892-140511
MAPNIGSPGGRMKFKQPWLDPLFGRRRRHLHGGGLLGKLPLRFRVGPLTNTRRRVCILVAAIFVMQLYFCAKYMMPVFFRYRMRTAKVTDRAAPTTSHNQKNQADFALFYHIYVPEKEEPSGSFMFGDYQDDPQANALRIIDEQMHQIGISYAAADPLQPAKLYYNTLGVPNIVTDEYMDTFCGPNGLYNLDCIHLQHYDEGMETKTLENVHDFCQQPQASEEGAAGLDTRRVVYLHNKGSFHENPINEQWRRLMTYAVTTEQCLNPPTPEIPSIFNNGTSPEQCNLCGLYFIAERGLFMPGNIWTAQCDYVSRLLPPLEFGKRSTEVVKDALLMHLEHRFEMDLFNFVPDNYGVNRYADELWIGSHPSIQPCDWSLHKKSNFGFGHGDPFFEFVLGIWDPFQTTWKTLEWTMSPSLPMVLPVEIREHRWWHVLEFAKAQRHRESKRIREFSLLGGNLYKWIHIYGQVPPPSSWTWSWFPDGEMWRGAVEKHGKNAVEEVTQAYKDVDHAEFLDPIYTHDFRRLRDIQLWYIRRVVPGI